MSQELYEDIVNAQNISDTNSTETDYSTSTWLTFSAGNKKYAIQSNLIQEILRNNDIFPIPFVPPYIKGVLNSYGTPYAVLDISLFLENEIQNSKLFMILKGDYHTAIQITDLQEFHTLNDIEIQDFIDEKNVRFFSSVISYQGESIPIMNVDAILSTIREEIEKI